RLRPAMFGNILVVGGTANLPGLRDRLQMEIQALAPAGTAVRVVVPGEHRPEFSAWLGATRQLDQWQVSRERYHELGPDRIVAHFDQLK
ncbi:actin, partial [Coemansia sp. RSA 2599]